MKLLKKEKEKIVFSAEMNNGLTNAIRRYVGQIPVMAIDEVEISKNDSPLYDETIAHRAGLVPLERGKVSVKGKEIELSLSADSEGNVYSGKLKGSIKVAYDKIPLTALGKDQELELKATARIGRGNEHAKFSPGLLIFRESIEVKIDKDCPQEIRELLPKKLYDKSGKISIESSAEADQCEEAAEYCQKQGKEYVKIEQNGEMIITLESYGQIPVEDIFKEAIEALKSDLEEVKKKV